MNSVRSARVNDWWRKASTSLTALYATPFLTVLVALLVRLPLAPYLGTEVPFMFFWPAVIICAWIGGFGPGLFATVLSLVAAFHFIFPSAPLQPADIVGMILFIFLAGGMSLICESARAARKGRRRAEADALTALAESDLLRVTLSSIGDGVLATGTNGHVTFLNPVAEKLTGWKLDEALGQPFASLFQIVHQFTREPVLNPIAVSLREGKSVGLANHTVLISRDGTERPIDDRAAPIRDDYGTMIGAVLVFRDVSDRYRAEAELRERKELLRNVIAHIPCAVFWKDHESVFLGCNERFAQDAGLNSPEDVVGKRDRDLGYSAAEIAAFDASDREVLVDGKTLVDREETLARRNGTRGTVLMSKVPLRDAEGTVVGVLGVYTDITERIRLEEQYRQSLKLQAVGRLAGGVSHDFNNLLTVITGYGSLVGDLLPKEHPARDLVGEMVRAGERAANLTRQLLAFSRKQVIAPRVLDLSATVGEMERMLRRVIGEDIEFAVSFQPFLGLVRADPGQIEQVLMNLAVNARDAMPKGGKLTIETRNVELSEDYAKIRQGVKPGRYILLAVADTGVGMTDDVKAHAFEPFFTTKEVGKGTGLGLSTVHGIVQQSNGHIEIYSEAGLGTVFKIYWPRADDVRHADALPSGLLAPPLGTETILLAEDEPAVRALAVRYLRQCNYTVLEACNGAEALRIAKEYEGPIHLLVTDVVMPVLSGRELAQQLLASRPTTRVLYVSGYTDDAIVRHGVLSAEVAFLQKPFPPTVLAQRVRETLDTVVA